jgi:hypothetical protein
MADRAGLCYSSGIMAMMLIPSGKSCLACLSRHTELLILCARIGFNP